MDWISKKELLELTGISYGQLYRWKRERLIPDSWFVKRSAVTGQETFLPRERVLERIRFIQENRDTWPLNRMQEILNPTAESRSYSPKELAAFPSSAEEIDEQRRLCGERTLSHPQAVCALLAAQTRREAHLNAEESSFLLKALNFWQEKTGLVTGAVGSLTIFRLDSGILPLLSEAEAPLHAPENAAAVALVRLGDAIPKISTALSAFHREA